VSHRSTRKFRIWVWIWKMKLVLGVDAGGTASRALVTTAGGTRVGYGRAGAGNPVVVTPEVACANVAEAITAALSNVEHKGCVAAAVVGAAGAAGWGAGGWDGQRPGGSGIFEKLLPSLGLDCPLRVVGDVVIAFAAGTTAPSGTVLIAGTGASAARVDGFTEVRVADGLGWLLGDLGSGFWLGRQAASLTARALLRGTKAKLVESITAAIGKSDPDGFVVAVHTRPPRELATLAPLVTEAALAGDELALSIVEDAAGHLVTTVGEVRAPGDTEPIILAGSVLAHGEPIRSLVVKRLAELWPGAEVRLAGPGELGAARLAMRCLL
jgi:glucosamine kinase